MLAKAQVGQGWGMIIYLPLTPKAYARRKQAHRFLKGIRQRGPEVAEMVGKTPAPLLCGRYEGIPYFVEALLPGKPVTYSRGRGEHARTFADARDLIWRFHEATATLVELDGSYYQRTFGGMMKKLAFFDPQPESGRIAVLTEWVASLVQGSCLPLVSSHGDYKLENCLVDSTGMISGVIDWELARLSGLPFLDLLHLWVSRQQAQEGGTLRDILATLLYLNSQGKPLDPSLDAYTARWHITAPQLTALFIAYWVRYLIYNIEPLKFIDPRWIKRIFFDILALFEDYHR
jgi:hypothetical protein